MGRPKQIPSGKPPLRQIDDHLPPQDRGSGAWKCLFGLWIIEAFLWGFPLAFGVFQLYYSSQPAFVDDKHIPTIGALSLAIPYLGLPFVNILASRYPEHLCYMLCAGWFFCLFSLVAASFATKVWHLILTQGLMYGVAQTFWFSPSILLINQWFGARRGLAFGILFGASGASGLVLPFALDYFCRQFGFRWALRGFVLVTLTISGPTIYLVRRRQPATLVEARQLAEPRQGTRWTGRETEDIPHASSASLFEFIKNPWVYPYAAAAMLQGLAFFLPAAFLPSYSTSLGHPQVMSDLLLVLSSLAQLAGQVVLGYISDEVHPMLLPTVTTACSGLAALLLWGFAKAYSLLAVFSVVWGFSAGSYSVLWARACEHVTKDADESTTLYGIISFERGIFVLLTGPFSEMLLGADFDRAAYGVGTYAWTVIFVGSAALLSAAAGVAYLFEPRKEAAQAHSVV